MILRYINIYAMLFRTLNVSMLRNMSKTMSIRIFIPRVIMAITDPYIILKTCKIPIPKTFNYILLIFLLKIMMSNKLGIKLGIIVPITGLWQRKKEHLCGKLRENNSIVIDISLFFPFVCNYQCIIFCIYASSQLAAIFFFCTWFF